MATNYKKNKRNYIILCFFAFYFFVGINLYNDYGISWDEDEQRNGGFISLKYVTEKIFPEKLNKIEKFKSFSSLSDYDNSNKNLQVFYGVVFDLPMAFIETYFNINHSKNYYLIRHFFNFLIFFISVIFFYHLSKNRFKDWRMGILGALFLILSPRIFAESFYNNKDVVFMSFFIISLSAGIKFLQSPSIASSFFFSLMSALLTDVRVLGIFIPVVVLFFLFIKILRNTNFILTLFKPLLIFFIFFPIFVVLFWPYLWEAPISNFITSFNNMKVFDMDIQNFYLGEYVSSKNLPWHYPFVWIGITTPPLFIIFFIFGFSSSLVRVKKRLFKLSEKKNYNDIWRGENEMIDLFFIVTSILPLLLVLQFDSTLYDGWRQLYFIYPSLLMISLLGFHNIRIKILHRKKNLLLILPTFISLLYLVFWSIEAHPFQNIYFNFLSGKDVKNNFEMDYWGLSNRKALEHIINNDKRPLIKIWPASSTSLNLSKEMLNNSDKSKITITMDKNESDYILTNFRYLGGDSIKNKITIPSEFKIYYEIKVDGITINRVFKK